MTQIRSLIVFILILQWPAGPIGQTWALPANGQRIMIAGPSPYAVDIGKDIARKGGNVVDVAVAVALSLAVTHPYYAALGGGGFALIKMGDKLEALDFREVAPKATSPTFYLDKAKRASIDGPLAVGVPGVPAGLWEMHKKYGKLHWSRLFAKPIELATKGFEVSGEWAENTQREKDRFNAAGKRHFFKKGAVAYRPGDVIRQPQLGTLLKEMSNRGIAPFYEGLAAQDIVKTLKAAGGVITLEDLRNYKVRWLKPMTTEFQGHKIHLMPPPSSGGVVISSALKMIDMASLKTKPALSVDELHWLAEIMKLAFHGRVQLGDPDFHKNPLETLMSEAHLKSAVTKIKPDKTLVLESIQTVEESKETTHFSVMDGNGNAVAFTVTLNGNYGSAMVTEKLGIALNNEMDDFTTRPNEPNMFGLIQGPGNAVEPGKRPLSSMSPTLVEKDGKIVMALGSPGGPRIITGVLQVLYRVLVTGYDMDLAIQTPRVHHQFLPDILFIDRNRFAPETVEGLKAKGHVLQEGSTAKVYGVRTSTQNLLEGAFDSRGEGAAGGF